VLAASVLQQAMNVFSNRQTSGVHNACSHPRCCWSQALADMLVEVCKNPKSPGFNHYLFESVAALIKHGAAADKAQLATYEATLFPAFDIVLSNDVQVRGAYSWHAHSVRGGAWMLACCDCLLCMRPLGVQCPADQYSRGAVAAGT
jgi:hypothetical protein